MPDLLIDESRRSVYLKGLEMQLSPQEYRVLHWLGCHVGEVVSKVALLPAMWTTDDPELAGTTSFDPMAINLVIFRLRKKLGDNAQHPIYLETRRGFGYILHHSRVVRNEASQVDARVRDNWLTQHAPSPPLLATEVNQPWSTLTRREWAIFLLLGDEQTIRLTDKALAQQLQMAEGTLKKHLQHIYRKLEVENRSGAAFLAMRVRGQR